MLYVVERLDDRGYDHMMLGSNDYCVEKVEVEAGTPEEAIKLASIPGYVVNEKYVKTKEELDREKAEREREWAEREAKEAAERQRKIDRETEKAAAYGLTREVYNRIKRHESKVRRCEWELEDAQDALERARQILAKIKTEAGLAADEVVK